LAEEEAGEENGGGGARRDGREEAHRQGAQPTVRHLHETVEARGAPIICGCGLLCVFDGRTISRFVMAHGF